MAHPHQDLTRSTLAVLFIGGLIAASFWVMRPFLPGIIWAVTLVIATWPLMLRVQHYTGNRRAVAVSVMTLGLLLVLEYRARCGWRLHISTINGGQPRIKIRRDLVRTVLSFRVPPLSGLAGQGCRWWAPAPPRPGRSLPRRGRRSWRRN